MSAADNDEKAWKVLKRKKIIKDQWIDLEATECQLPNGKIVNPYYVNHARDFAVIVAITPNKELVAEKQYRHGIEKVLLEIPAGMIEPGEMGETAAYRELMEETGYKADNMTFLFKIAPNASYTSNYAWCYLAQNVVLSQEQELDETEDLTVVRVPLNKVRKMLQNGEFCQAVHVAALYRALEVLGEK